MKRIEGGKKGELTKNDSNDSATTSVTLNFRIDTSMTDFCLYGW